jgi:choline dehydrogenase-like flavoprotein
MILDSRDSELPIDMEADIAIVGSGPAGISIARALDDRFSVLLIEAGGLAARPVDDHWLDGEVTGLHYPLRETRARQFGG